MQENINYNWKITKLECFPDENKIVTKVHWAFTATKNHHTSTSFGEVDIDYDLENQNFIDYNSLTEEQIIEWTKIYIEKYQSWNSEDKLKGILEKNIEELELKELKEHTLPWENFD
jgi:hypothetical protein